MLLGSDTASKIPRLFHLLVGGLSDDEVRGGKAPMSNLDLNWIANFIWGIADDVLRDLYVRGRYRDVILPMTVLRRLDAVLEPTKKAVLDAKANLDRQRLPTKMRPYVPHL